MNELEIAWAAGLFDGEGSTSAHKSGNGRRYLLLQVGQTDDEVLIRFRDAVGVGKVNGPYRTRSTRKSVWHFTVKGQGASDALLALWPFLSTVKREQALRAIGKVQASFDAMPVRRSRTGRYCAQANLDALNAALPAV